MQAFLAGACALVVLLGCSEGAAPDDATQPVRSPDIPRVRSASETLAGAHIPTVDPGPMNDAEIARVLGAGPVCAFRYLSTGRPVLAMQPQARSAGDSAVVKLNGSLVPLQLQNADAESIVLLADNVRLTLMPHEALEHGRANAPRLSEADLLFEIDKRLRVGYRGYYGCSAAPPS